MIKFNLPGLYEHFDLNMQLLDDIAEMPEIFYPNIEIESFYGNFQFCIFDGGRIFCKYNHTCKEEIEFMVNEYNKRDIAVRLIFTNNMIQPIHYTDRFANLVLDICHNGKNEIVITNPGLEEYIRNKYPNFNIISSTTKCLNTKEAFKNELKKNYDLICLDYNLNNKFDFLNSLTQEEKDKCEFLCNAICNPGCPNRKDHYRLNGIYYLNYGKPYSMEHCVIKGNTLHPLTIGSKNNISPESIFNDYVPNGFNHFKLEGRTLSITENVCNFVRYLIKPEYQQYYIVTTLNKILENYHH